MDLKMKDILIWVVIIVVTLLGIVAGYMLGGLAIKWGVAGGANMVTIGDIVGLRGGLAVLGLVVGLILSFKVLDVLKLN